MCKRNWLGLMIIGLLCWGAIPATASVVLKLSDAQMTLHANVIVRGKVVNKVSRWDKKHRRIFTYVTVAVLESLKGKKQREIVIRQLGGSVNGIGMRVPGAATYNLGEEVVVFLEPAQRTTMFHVMGMSYGKLRVLRDPKTQKSYVLRDLRNITTVERNKKGRFQLKHSNTAMTPRPIPLAQFTKQIKGHLRQLHLIQPALPMRTLKPLPRTIRAIPTLKKPTLKAPTRSR